MKLHHSPASPYVRKARVVAHEHGMTDQLELLETFPGTILDDVGADNPLAQIPTLVMHDGTAIYDSAVICEYLDSIGPGEKLIPNPGARRWQALTLQALGDAITDAAIANRSESQRPEDERSDAMIEKRAARLGRCLDRLEADTGQLEGRLTIGHIAVACALGYLDFRFPADYWRPGHPKLAAWYDEFATRPSMAATPHPAP